MSYQKLAQEKGVKRQNLNEIRFIAMKTAAIKENTSASMADRSFRCWCDKARIKEKVLEQMLLLLQ